MNRLHRLKVKVTIQGHVIYPSICVRSISPKQFELVLLYFIQMFLLVRQCVELMTQLQRLKVNVTVQGHRLYPWMLCPLHISWTLWKIFIKFWSNAYLIKTVCRAFDSTTQAMGQGIPWISCLFHTSEIFEKIPLISVWRYVEQSPLSCHMLHISDCLLAAGYYICPSQNALLLL